MSDIKHFEFPETSGFVGSRVLATTKRAATKSKTYGGGTPVLDRDRKLQGVAWWGAGNRFPQDVIKDISTTSLIGSVIERKVEMLVGGGGLCYGIPEYDKNTGQEVIRPMRIDYIEDWLEETNISLYLNEAARDWYTFYNLFPEFTMGRGRDRIVGIECKDASHVRLNTQNEQGDSTEAIIGDWSFGLTMSESFARIHALNPYFRVADQIRELKKTSYILPIRTLDRGQFYYGIAPWNGLRATGWIDVAKRVPELKKYLLSNLMHLRYHIEFAETYWTTKYKDFEAKSEDERLQIIRDEVALFDKWAKGEKGQGGVYWSLKKASLAGDLQSLVTINEMKMSLPEGAYLQDAQEADFIICRDLGLKPSLHGISPSKSGSSPGSGSEDRVARTNHILDQKMHADKILQPLEVVRNVNGWPKGLKFYFQNYYAATLDRTMQVGNLNTNPPNSGD